MNFEEWVSRSEIESIPPRKSFATSDNVQSLIDRAMDHIRSDWKFAKHYAQLANRLAVCSQDLDSIGKALRIQGHVYLLGGKSKPAVRFYKRAREKFGKGTIEHANTAVAMVQALAYTGDYEQAFEVADQAVADYERFGESAKVARIQANVANTLHRLDRLVEAKEIFSKVIPLLKEHHLEADLSIVLRNYGVCLMGLQEFEEADHLYAQAREFFVQAENSLLVFEIDLNRAYLCGRKGEILQALLMYRELQGTLPEDSGFEIGHCLLDQADFMNQYGLWSDAEIAAQKAIEIFERLEARFEVGKARLELAVSLIHRKDLTSARQELDSARSILLKEPNKNWKALYHWVESDWFDLANQPKRSLRAIQRSLKLEPNSERLRPIQQKEIELLISLGQLDQAREKLASTPFPHLVSVVNRSTGKSGVEEAKLAIKSFDDQRSELLSTGLRRGFIGSNDSLLRECFRSLKDTQDRLEVVLRIKDHSLLDYLNNQSLLTSGIGLSEGEILSSKREEENLKKTQARTVDLPTWAKLKDTFIELFEDNGDVFAFVITPLGFKEFQLGTTADLVEIHRYFSFNLTRLSESGEKLTYRALDRLKSFLSPILPFFDNRVVIGRTPSIGSLPIHAIQLDSGFLGDQCSISFVPSSSFYESLRRYPRTTGSGTAIAGVWDENSPEIEVELAELSRRFSVPILSSKSDIANSIKEVNTVHLAAHGIVRADQPLFNGLLLGTETWTALDFLKLRLKASIVVLSGCSTGVSITSNDMESQGFIESLLAVGAKNVVATLWDAADLATKEWMLQFYDQLPEQGAVNAMKHATREIRNRWSHPAIWGPYAHFGGFS